MSDTLLPTEDSYDQIIEVLDDLVHRYGDNVHINVNIELGVEEEPSEPPVEDDFALFNVTDDKAVAWHIVGYNDSDNIPGGYPILELWGDPGERVRYDQGQTVYVAKTSMRADGSKYFRQLMVGNNEGVTVPPTPDLYLYNGDITYIS